MIKNKGLQISKFYFFKVRENLTEKEKLQNLFPLSKDNINQSVNIFKGRWKFMNEIVHLFLAWF